MAKTLVTSTVIKINDREINNSFKGIRSEVVRLEMGLKKLTPGTEEFRKKAEELKNVRSHFERVKNEIDLVNGKIKESGGVFGFLQRKISNLGDIFKQVFSANITERFLSNIFSSGKQTIDQLLKVADAMTDVEKTSGMTTEQVKKLWDEFDDMDTRTGKLERLKIAEVGGRLGVPIDEMRDFVQEID
jgi:tubulin-specific chaperone A